MVAQTVKRLPAVRETRVQSLDWEDPLEKEMATHSSTLAWKIPWTEEPGRLQSMGLQRVGHDWATSLSLFFQCSIIGLSWWLSSKEWSAMQETCGRCGFGPWVKKILWGRNWQPIPVFWPGNSMDREAWQATVYRVRHNWVTKQHPIIKDIGSNWKIFIDDSEKVIFVF